MIEEFILPLVAFFVLLAIWEIVWKAIAMWHSARRGQKAWFIFILIFNTAGILPIIYLIVYRDRQVKKSKEVKKSSRKKR